MNHGNRFFPIKHDESVFEGTVPQNHRPSACASEEVWVAVGEEGEIGEFSTGLLFPIPWCPGTAET